MYDLLRKYGGSLIVDDIKAGRRKFRLTKPPRFLALHVKRFVKNQFFLEKNPTIVNFPVKNLEVPVSAPGAVPCVGFILRHCGPVRGWFSGN